MSAFLLRTERLTLSPRSRAELCEVFERETDAHMKNAYREMIACMDALPGREEWGADWRIALHDGTEVGSAGFKGAADERGTVELGYGIDAPHRRRGYAAEAVQALTEWALACPGVRRVTAQTEPDNEASQRVLRRCGFTPCGMGEEGPMMERLARDNRHCD